MRRLITPKRLAVAALCVASLVVCCGLAYWQWERFSEAGGTFQNLGYVFQWPLFGLFPAFVVWRMVRLESRRKAEAATSGTAPHAAPDAPPHAAPEPAPHVATDVAPHAAPGADEVAPEPVAVPSQPVVTVEPVRAPAADDEDEELAAYNRMLAALHARDQR
ncbi:hypothetical protein AB0G02_14385 [Actinosynnema sp. NPDC023658]|uniref:hypothetical protein n=1 Tax=Actinosynnema sp. NPDC023658 TaxID=3155465 RepID=UPI0033FB9AFE